MIRLIRNDRSTPQVVTLPTSWPAGPGPSGPSALVAQRPRRPAPQLTDTRTSPPKRLPWRGRTSRCSSPDGRRRDRRAGPDECADQSLEQALGAAGVSFQLRGAERFFDRAEVRQAVGLLRAAAGSASAAAEPADEVRPILASIGLTPSPPGGRAPLVIVESLEALPSWPRTSSPPARPRPWATVSRVGRPQLDRACSGDGGSNAGVAACG